MPTLLLKQVFSFHPKATPTKEQLSWLQSERAVDVIVKILQLKLTSTGKAHRMYFLKGRTGSGKSTLMISTLYEMLIRGSGRKLICSEPRVVLTKANATDVIRYNKSYEFGKQMGVLSGAEKIICSERECMYYCTPQILNDKLLLLVQSNDKTEITRLLRMYRIIVIDEVHVLDVPMMALLKTIKDVINKYGEEQNCPLFLFASATIDIDQMVKYYFRDNMEQVYQSPLMIGDVKGSMNFPVDEKFLSPEQLDSFNKQEAKEGRNSCYRIITDYFVNNYYPLLDKSESFIRADNGEKIQCRDVLFFVPLTAGIDTIGLTLKERIKDRPIFIISKNVKMSEVVKWREANRGKQRVLFIGFAREYSPASDELLSKPIETDIDALRNEIRIVAATPVIETGKTIVTLYACIDMGLTTTSVNNPLSYDINNTIQYLKQIPTNMNQMIQRMGRVGRECPGKFLHFYSENVMKHFKLSDTAETINSGCLSSLLLTHLHNYPLHTKFDVANENHYLYPMSIDLLIRSVKDLICAGYLTVNGQLVNFCTSFKFAEPWVLYARYLYHMHGYSLWNALLTAAINRKSLGSILTVSIIRPESLRYKLDLKVVNDDVIEGIKLARNMMTSILYGKDKSFGYDEKRIY